MAVKISNAYPKDVEAPASGVDDMTRLAYLHEPGVLQNMKIRFDTNTIYVSILLNFVANEFFLYIFSISSADWSFLNVNIFFHFVRHLC